MPSILAILAHLHQERRLHRMFALMAAKYYPMLTDEQLQSVFNALVEVVLSSADVVAVYESCRTLRGILAEKLGSLSIEGMGRAILVVIGMFSKFRNPSSVALLVQLANSVLDNVEFEPSIVDTIICSPEVAELLRSNEEVLIYHVCSFLEHLLSKTEREEVVVLALRFVRANTERTLDNPEVVYGLWVSALRSLQPGSPLLPESLALLEAHQEDIRADQPEYYCELMQEYLLLQAVSPTHDQVEHLVLTLCADSGDEPKAKNAALGLYLVWLELHSPQYPLSQSIAHLLFKTLHEISDRISSEMSALQGTVAAVVNLGIIAAGATYVAFLDGVVGARAAWTDLWLRNCRLVSTNEAEKTTTLALLLMLEYLDYEVVDRKFEAIVRQSLAQLDPLVEPKLLLARRGKVSRRRDLLRRASPVMAMSLRPLFK